MVHVILFGASIITCRNLNPTAASEIFVATLRWREEFKVNDAVKEEFPKDVFGQLGHIYGRDKEGRPVVYVFRFRATPAPLILSCRYNIYGGNQDLDAVFGDVERFLRWRVAFMERSLEMLDFANVDQTIQIHGTF